MRSFHQFLFTATASALLFALSFSTAAQTPSQQTPAATPAETARAQESGKLTIIVSDDVNKFVDGLRAEDFRVTADGEPQAITSFSREDSPLSYALLIDNSGSMRGMLDAAIRAGAGLIAANKAADEAMIVRFVGVDHIESLQEFTRDSDALTRALEDMYIEGGETALLEALDLAAREVASREPDGGRRHALVVITDGGDRARQVKLDELIKYLREHDVQVFVFALTDAVRADSFGGSGNSRGKARSLLNTLAEQTGGVALFPKKPAEFNAAVATLNGLLRSPRYVIGYAAKENLKDKPRKVEVKLADSATGGKRSLVVRPFVK